LVIVDLRSGSDPVQDEFTNEQFDSVIIEGREVFAKMAEEAVKFAKEGRVREFPA
jgi:hypothetical protein